MNEKNVELDSNSERSGAQQSSTSQAETPTSESGEKVVKNFSSSPSSQDELPDDSPYRYNPGDRKFHGRKKRQYWFQFWRFSGPPSPPPNSMDSATEIPIVNANYLSILTYQFITPIMVLGYRRPLEATDLWKMDQTRTAANLAGKLNSNFEERRRRAEERNLKIEKGEIGPGSYQKLKWRIEGLKARVKGDKEVLKMDMKEKERLWREKRPMANDSGFEPPNRSGQDKATVRMAMYDQFSKTLWFGVM